MGVYATTPTSACTVCVGFEMQYKFLDSDVVGPLDKSDSVYSHFIRKSGVLLIRLLNR